MPTPKTKNAAENENLTFEKVWAMFQETDRKFEEMRKELKEREETERRIRKEREEAEQRMRKEREEIDRLRKEEADQRRKELEKQMKETDRRIGELGNRFGELAEHLVAPSIMEKFNELGFHFTDRWESHEITEAGNPNVYTEVDIFLENGDIAIAVEVKAKAKQADVDDHIKRMEILRRRAERRHDKRKLQGAIAGAIMTKEVREYAHKKGFYVIEQSGDTVKIVIPDGFKPREW